MTAKPIAMNATGKGSTGNKFCCGLNLEKKQDLRASHFDLGKQPVSYESEFRAEYKAHQIQYKKDAALAGIIRASHFSLGDTAKKNMFQTTYEHLTKPRNLADAYNPPMPNKNFIASFNIGMNDKAMMVTENQRTYQRLPPAAYMTDAELKNKIRFIKGNHFNIGDDKAEMGSGHYISMKEEAYKPYAVAPVYQMNQETKKDLRASHFSVGVGKEQIISTTQVEFTDKSKMGATNAILKKNLRESHFSLGSDGYNYASEMMIKYRDPMKV